MNEDEDGDEDEAEEEEEEEGGDHHAHICDEGVRCELYLNS